MFRGFLASFNVGGGCGGDLGLRGGSARHELSLRLFLVLIGREGFGIFLS